jgi:hypothetical protein
LPASLLDQSGEQALRLSMGLHRLQVRLRGGDDLTTCCLSSCGGAIDPAPHCLSNT